MHFKKLLSILAITAYAFTAQLGVHVFAMHGNAMEHHEASNHAEDTHEHEGSAHTHEPKNKGCGHPEPTHDHNSHLTPSGEDGDHDHNDVMMCLTQSEGTLVSDKLPVKEIKVVGFIPPLPTYTITEALVEEKVFSNHDPGWGQDSSFAQFLETHYGSTVMHC